MSVLNTLKRFNADGLNLDELLEISAQAKALKAEYDAYQVETPEVLTAGLRTIRRAIDTKVQDDYDRRLSEARSRRATAATPEERRRALDEEIARLEQLTGQKSVTPTPTTA